MTTTESPMSTAEAAAAELPAIATRLKSDPAGKGSPTPKRSAVVKKDGGPKPTYAVVENALKCQSWDGEISLDLRIPLGNFEKLTLLESMEESESLKYITTEIMPADVSKQIYGLRDSAEALKFTMKWIEAVGERFGASLGELDGSSTS